MAALLTEAKRQHPSAPRAQFEETISVLIVAKDPISQAGVERKLLGLSDISVLTRSARRHPDIAIVVADTIDDEVLGGIRTLRRHSLSRIVVVAAERVAPEPAEDLALATEAGANGILPRSLADGTRLAWVIRQVRHGGTLSSIVADERAVAAPAKPAPAPDPVISAPATNAAPPVSDRTTRLAPREAALRNREVARRIPVEVSNKTERPEVVVAPVGAPTPSPRSRTPSNGCSTS